MIRPAKTPTKSKRTLAAALRIGGALAAAALLLLFLILTRILDANRVPDQIIRTVETIDDIAAPAPPPPPPADDTPPPPPPPLPQLEIQLDNIAPPVKAVVNQKIDLTMVATDFDFELDVPPPLTIPKAQPRPQAKPRHQALARHQPAPIQKSSYAIGELDSKPTLKNHPPVTYPSSMRRQGVNQGKAVLEVTIDPSGRVTIKRILSISHPDFETMARNFAARARFTVPKKNGQAVSANFIWPLTLTP